MRKHSSFLILLAYLISATVKANPTVDISGVIQNLGEQPIENAKILLANKEYSVLSDSDGYFEIVLEETQINNFNNSTNFDHKFHGTKFYYSNQNNENVKIQIFDLTGRKIYSKSFMSVSGINVVDFNEEFKKFSTRMGIITCIIGDTKHVYKTLLKRNSITISSIKSGGSSSSLYNNRKLYSRDIIDTLKVIIENDIKFLMPISTYFEGSLTITLDILPEVYTSKVNETPDYYQLDNAYGGFHNGGAVFCGPTTASNSLMWLSDNGYPELAGNYNDDKYAQFKMIETLGSDSYMGLGSGGVGPNGICYGVNKYIKAKGLNYKSMKYQGWRSVASAYYTGTKTPSMEWLKEGLMGTGSVWLNYGWYNYSNNTNTYNRNGGHWMTLVGFGWDGNSKEPNCLIVHDPWTGNTFNNYRKMSKITSGKLAGDYTGLPRNASGYYKYWTGSKYGIIDGVVVLKME